MTETFDPADAACWIARGRPPHHAHAIADAWRTFPDLPIGTPLEARMVRTRERTAMLKPLHEQIAQEGEQRRQATNFAFVERKVAEGSTDSRDAGILYARNVHGYDWDDAVAWAYGNYAARAGWEARPPSRTRLGEPDRRRGAYNQGFLDGGGQPDDIFDVARRSLTAVTPAPAKVASPSSSRPLPSQWPSPADLPAPASWHRRLLILGASEYSAGTLGILAMLHERPGHEETTICLIAAERGLYLLSEANGIASGDDKALRDYLWQRDYTDIVAIASEAEFARLDAAAPILPLVRTMERTRNSLLQQRAQFRLWIARGRAPGEQFAAGHIRWSKMAAGRLCCITRDRRKIMITCNYYATRTVLGVPICEKRLRIAARTLSSVI
ncbi:hypothetical protein [Sphingomonas sp. IC081]|uniref:hypothetical protein n=1 Tax=Sphingomonas sp. IC081 TaxID=304378 RepID=UPI00163B755F|nr:hypothetical protein [Sphingomonas sp. IC081]